MLNRKVLYTLLIVLLLSFAGVAAAQDGRGGRFGGDGERSSLGRFQFGNVFDGELQALIEEATGLTSAEIRQQLGDGTSLNDLIVANDGDPNAVFADIVAIMSTQIDEAVAEGTITEEQAERVRSGLGDRVSARLANEFEGRPGDRGPRGDRLDFEFVRELMTVIEEATGLSPMELREQAQGDTTLADVIVANGATVEGVVADAVAVIEAAVNEAVADGTITDQERVDQFLADLPANLTQRLEEGFGIGRIRDRFEDRRGERGEGREIRNLVDDVAVATSLTEAEVSAALREGSSLADLLAANGIDPTQFVNEQLAETEARLQSAVEEGRMSQAVADARLELQRALLNETLNRSFDGSFTRPFAGPNA